MMKQPDLIEMALDWLSAGDLNDRETMLDILDDYTDFGLTERMIEDCGLARVPFGYTKSWLRHNGVHRDEITRAFKKVRDEFDDYFPEEGA